MKKTLIVLTILTVIFNCSSDKKPTTRVYYLMQKQD